MGGTLQCALPEAHLRGLLAQLCVARVVKLQTQREMRGSQAMSLAHSVCPNNNLPVPLCRQSHGFAHITDETYFHSARQAEAGAHRVLAAQHGVQHHAAAPHWRTPHARSVSQPAHLTWQ